MTENQIREWVASAVRRAFSDGYRTGRDAGRGEVIAENTRFSIERQLVREFDDKITDAFKVGRDG